MKRFTFLKSLVMLFALCLLGTGVAWAQTEAFYESFDQCDGLGGNDGQWNKISTTSPVRTDNSGWTTTQGNGADKCIRLGSSKNEGKATTPSIAYSGKGTLVFKAGSWDGDNTTLNVSIDGATVDGETSFKLTDAQFEEFNIPFTATGASIKITFSATGKNERFFLDEVIVKNESYVTPPTFSLEEGTYNLGQSHELEITAGEGTTIYYALNGSDTYNEYTRPIILNQTTTVSAYAQDADGNRSEIVEATYTFEVTPPTFSLEEGTYNLGQSYELEITAGEGTTIYYALNGDDTYNEYTRPIILNKTTIVSAYAEDAEGNQSDIVEATYTFSAPSSTIYNKVTSIDELEEGAIYLIVAEGKGKALSAQDNTNYRSDASVEINDNSISTGVNASGLPYELTLGKDGDNYTFYDATSEGYLSLNKNENQLHTSSSLSENAQWNITISGEETHLNSVAYSDREIRYNSSQPRFACYKGSQQPVTLYKKAAAATTGTFTIGEAGYATFFTDWTFVMPEGVEGGIVTSADDGRLTVDYCYHSGTTVPANTGLLLKGAAKTYTYNLSTETPDAPKVNYLKGSVDGGMTEGEDCLFYMLSYDQNNENLGFYWGAADGAAFKSGAGKAYLALPQAVASQVRGFILDGTTTGISGVTTEANNAPAAVYSLTGVRMGTTTDGLPAGIYIVNGKKVLVK